MIDDIGARSIPAGKRFARAIPSAIRDGIGLSAVGLISYGAWLIHPSAGFITAGTLTGSSGG